jgi:hypothetical protein
VERIEHRLLAHPSTRSKYERHRTRKTQKTHKKEKDSNEKRKEKKCTSIYTNYRKGRKGSNPQSAIQPSIHIDSNSKEATHLIGIATELLSYVKRS